MGHQSHRKTEKALQERTGKLVGGALYLHRSAIHTLSETDADLVSKATARLPSAIDWSVVKLNVRMSGQVSFLDYEDFDQVSFPALKRSCLVDLNSGQVSVRSYSTSNPPILHRKELLLASDDPRRERYERLTNRLEELGLFQNMHKMGYRKQWENVLANNGLDSQGHRM